MLRPVYLLMFLSLSACGSTHHVTPQFALADTGQYMSDAEKQRASLIAQTDCKVKALSAGSTIEKSIASEHNSRENLYRAREQADEMYTSSYTLCMLNAGFTQQ